LLLCVLLGISFGLGIPSCMAFLADSTKIEERARVSGTIILLTFCIVILASFAVSSLSFGLIGIALLCLVRATSFFALFLDPCDRKKGRKKRWRRILNHRDFASYLFPWLMFNVASGLIYLVWSWLPSSQDYLNAMAIGNPLHFIAAGVFGFISGILADRIGRKLIIIIGLALLGVSFALLGFFTSSLSVIIYLFASGVAWGFLLVVFLAVPGDLATSGSKERFYALGAVVPLIIYTGFSLIAQMLGVYASATTLSTLLSIIIFISVIPVLYASETLPENKVQSRKLKEYLLKVNKTSKKNQEEQ